MNNPVESPAAPQLKPNPFLTTFCSFRRFPAQTRVTGRVTTSNLDLRSARERERVFLTRLRAKEGTKEGGESGEGEEEERGRAERERKNEPRNFASPVAEELSIDDGAGSMGSNVEEFGRSEETRVEEIFEGSFDVTGMLRDKEKTSGQP